MVWNRWSVLRSAAKQIAKLDWNRSRFELQLAYCPELTPVEAMWSHANYADLANVIADDMDHLQAEVDASLADQAHDHQRKFAIFKTAQLRL